VNKSTMIFRMLAFEKFLLGMNYSQPNRLNIYKGGSADCSSLQAAAMSFAGFPLLSANNGELLVSNTEVYAQGYNLIYPSSTANIGKVLPSSANVENNLQPGDIVFFNFNSSTERTNKITHIGAVLDSGHLIQTCNNTVKCSIYTIPWGATRICAIIRLKDNITDAPRPNLQLGSKGYAVRMLQAILNYELSAKLKWDGDFGSATQTALKQFQQKVGLPITGVVGTNDWTYLFKENIIPTPPPIPTPSYPTLKKGDMGTYVKTLQTLLNAKGYTPKLVVDGDFGNKTLAGVEWFQMHNKDINNKPLVVDGVVGPKTWEALLR
jgi:peptidoglycan hydrolase-like protein with peptidoglycan-binding domain